jgi:integrase
MDRTSIWRQVQARARACGLEKRVCCHSFRATGITAYMNAGGALDIVSASPVTPNFPRPRSTTDHRTV